MYKLFIMFMPMSKLIKFVELYLLEKIIVFISKN